MEDTRNHDAGGPRAAAQPAALVRRAGRAAGAHTGRRHGRVARVLTLAALYAAGCAALYVAVRAIAYITLGVALMLGTVPV